MRELYLLIKINFLQMLHSVSVGNGGKKNMGAAGALLLMGFLALYLSGTYSWMLGMMFRDADVTEFLLPVMSLFAVVISLLFTLMSASGTVFGGKDMDFMLSIPVSPFLVMLSKMTALYLENLVFVGLWMLPAGVAGFVFGVTRDWGYFLRLPLIVLTLPLLSSFIACLGGWLMAYAGTRMKHRALAANLISFALFLLLFAGSMRINELGTILLTNRERAERIFATWLLPFGLLGKGMGGNILAFLSGLLLCAIPFLVLAWLLSKRYKRIISGLTAQVLRTDFRLTRVETKGQGRALFQKEISRLFSTPAYLMNTCISAVLLIGFAAYIFVDRENAALFLGLLGEDGTAPLLLLCAALLLSMIYPSAVSISLEGRTLWILKEAPISPSALFAAKAGLNLALAWPASLTAIALFFAAGYLSAAAACCMLAVCMTLTALLAAAGVAVNLHFPKLDGESDIRVVKNSASAMLCAFGGMIFTLLLAGVWALMRAFLPFEGFCLLLSFVLAALTAALWRYLTGRGAERFMAL